MNIPKIILLCILKYVGLFEDFVDCDLIRGIFFQTFRFIELYIVLLPDKKT